MELVYTLPDTNNFIKGCKMIIQCPKCKTCFEVPDDVLNGREEMKFQCAECAYVWTEGKKQVDGAKMETGGSVVASGIVGNSVGIVDDLKGGVFDSAKVGETGYAGYADGRENVLTGVAEKSRELPSVFQKDDDGVMDGNEDEKVDGVEKRKSFLEKLGFTHDNVVVWSRIFVCALAVAIVVLIGVVSFSYFVGGEKGANGIFSAIGGEAKKDKKLYIEIAKPLTLVREGANEYLIIRGFIYNPTDVAMVVPKLVVILENKDGLILQEQEREVDAKSLAPLEKTDFMFKVFKNSSQVSYVKVDFVDVNKI